MRIYRVLDHFIPCADPESFVRGGRGEGRSKYHYNGTIIEPPAKRHLNDDGQILNLAW